jgi:hypothetical protein
MAIAADYMSVEAAQHGAFKQADRFEELHINLTTEQQRAILLSAGSQPQHGKLHIYRAWQGTQLLGHVFVDEVIGRQNLITYAIAIDISGTLGDVEILSYRESHGGEVRNGNWRKQFNGRTNLNQLRFIADIKNIAGATLSCEHVTQGIRWLYALWQTALQDSH